MKSGTTMTTQDNQRCWGPQEIEWLFFDFFGTLYRMVPTPLQLCHQLVHKLGGGSEVDCSAVIRVAAVADNAIYRLIDKNPRMPLVTAMEHPSWEAHLDKLQKLTGLDKEQTRILFQGWHDHWAVPGTQVQPFQNATEIVNQLHQRGFRIGVLSNGEWNLDPLFERDGFGESIRITISSGSVGYQKPQLQIFKVASDAVNCLPSKCALIGDTIETDVDGAQKAGWLPVFLKRPRRKYSRTVSNDVLTISSLRQLLDHFK